MKQRFFPYLSHLSRLYKLRKVKYFIFKATVEVKPEVELGEYMGLEVGKGNS